MHEDARMLVRACQYCQVHKPVPRNPQQKLSPITSTWPFYKWGIEIVGPFPEGPGKVKFLIVAINYFTKFGLPGEIISDNGKQFQDNPFKDWCEKLCIRQHFASVKHPQTNGLVERANRSLGEGIKARLDERSKNWMEELPHVLWAHHTMIKTAKVDPAQNNEALEINLDLLEEWREQAAIHEAKSKAKMEKYYNSKVQSTIFKLGDLVYRNNEASRAKDIGKLGPIKRTVMEPASADLEKSATSRSVMFKDVCKSPDAKTLRWVMEFESAQSNTTATHTQTRLQKIVSRLAILGVVITQEELNLKFLRSLPREWNTHVVVWMNKADIEPMSIDDLYNNFKIVEQDVKKSVGTSIGAQNLAFMTAPSTSSTNDANTVNPAYEVSTVSPNINTACPQVSTANFSDNIVNGFEVAAISAKYEGKKVECFNCHKMGHFAREYRAPKNKEGQFRYQDNTRKQGNNEDISSKAMLAIDGVGFDWSDMAEEQVQTNMALMAFSDSEVYNDKTCSKTCLKNYETLKKQCDDLIVKLNQTEFTAATYKRGLATVEEQLITYRKNEVLFSEEVAVLKREVACKDYEINVLKKSQITDKSKKGLVYNVVPPPHPLIYNRPKKLDLSYSGLDEFKDPEFKSYGSEDSKQESNIVCDKKLDDSKENSDDSLVKEQVSEDTSSFVESSLNVEKETVFLDKKIEFVKPNNHEKPVKKSVSAKVQAVNTARPKAVNTARAKVVKTVRDDTGFVDSGCSRHMTRKIAYLLDFKEFDGGYVTFGGGAHGGRISSKGTLKSDSLDFEDLPDESQILLKIPRKDNMYSFDMKNIVPKESLTCLVAKATLDESMLWHRRLGHINFKNINKLVKDNLVRGLPTKRFENDQTCVACLKGKQHRASCKSKVLNPITKPLFMLHMDLFGPTFVSSLMHKKYCLVVTNDYSRFTWVFFLATKDETSEILKNFIKEIENLVDKKVKIIRCDNGTEFKNKVMDDFCREKGIRREYSVARTPQQNGVAERRNRILIEVARIMLADSKLPTTFWAEAVSTACYVQNRVLVVKPHNKTPYELFRGFKPALSFMRPFGCHVTILNTLDNLGKFDGKSDEGFFVGYSLSGKAFRGFAAALAVLKPERLKVDKAWNE
ncbi:putative ribonuclease H-like domain-containing protein [Tanacetum coccineum]